LPTLHAKGTYPSALRLIDAADLGSRGTVKLHANTLKQTVLCYLERGAK